MEVHLYSKDLHEPITQEDKPEGKPKQKIGFKISK